MNFKKIFIITFLLLTVLSLSAVSAENVTDEVISDSADVDNVVSTQSALETPSILAEDESGNETTSNVTANSSIVSNDLTKYYKNSSQFYATFFDGNGTPLNNASIKLTINNGTYYRFTNASGTVRFAINLEPGQYILNATNPVTNETVSNNVTVLSTLNSSDVVKYYRNDTQYYVTVLNNATGTPLAGASLTFNINGVFYNRTTNASGVARLNINLNSGNYILTATNLANGERKSNNITVLPSVNGENIRKYYKNATQYYANFTDKQGNPLVNATVEFNINGVFYNRTTNANGTARLNINLEAGNYVLTATNPTTGEKMSNNVTVLSTIAVSGSSSGANISMSYGANPKYSVTVYNDNGSVAANKSVRFNINGVFYDRTSNENGTASLNINLLPGNYTITAYWGESRVSNLLKIRVEPSISVLNTTIKRGDYLRFRLTETVSGNPVQAPHYGVVMLNESTQPYGAYPDASGIVQMKIDETGVPVGNYMTYFGMIDDGWYSQKFVVNTINII